MFASLSTNPTQAQELLIQSGIAIGPGAASANVSWDTTTVPIGAYSIFAEIDDRTFNAADNTGNLPVRVTTAQTVSVAPEGSQPATSPPQLLFIDPLPNLGLSSQDEMTIRYIYADTDSNVTVTLLLDKDLDATNDDVSNPGDPNDPNTNIIILPSTARLATDPTFPLQADTDEIRTNPRGFFPTVSGILPFPGAPIAGQLKEYRFTIDFAQIPVRTQPYFVRAFITDGTNSLNAYAVGSLTISSLASGTVDVGEIGFRYAGARFQGFSTLENLGTDFVDVPDIDGDGQDEVMIASRFASPKNRPQSGAAYLIFGRRKTPFPPDTNNNGLPDVPGPGGPVDFPPIPDYLPNPYDSKNVGRFGGIISINSVSSFFRGTTYCMPGPRFSLYNDPPPEQEDPDHVGIGTAGLTSITRINLSDDGILDFVFGLPYISGAYDHSDDDPSDGGCNFPYGYIPSGCPPPPPLACVIDRQPNYDRCDTGGQHPGVAGDDDMGLNLGYIPGLIPPVYAPGFGDLDQGMFICVDGTTDLRNVFRKTVEVDIAGQFDPGGTGDDDGVLHGAATTPNGFRVRGGWYPERTVFNGVNFELRITNDNEFGATVAAIPSLDNDLNDELLVSCPGQSAERGIIRIFVGGNIMNGGFYAQDGVKSIPAVNVNTACGGTNCAMDAIPPIPPATTPTNVTYCVRGCQVLPPVDFAIVGELAGDRLGYAGPAGQFNQDGVEDILAGAPGADRDGLINNGVLYVFFTPQGGFGNVNLSVNPPPHLKIIGTHDNDRFGLKQSVMRDVNGDGIADVGLASEFFDYNISGSLAEEQDVGFVGVIFGNRPLTGENGFSPLDIGTGILSGVKFFGPVAGALAGHDFSSAGDFNQDGFGDLIISCPGETRTFAGQTRRGVVYLVFGGPHLANMPSFNLSQVGSATLPGIVFIGRSFAEDAITDVAPLDTCGGVGDVDGDGFDDIMIGATHQDFVNTASPDQRRIDAGEAYLIYGSNFGTNVVP
ncbi:MAG: integrin alpha [Planctomycetota bacterium]